MQPHEVMHIAMDHGHRKGVAAATGLKVKVIDRWTQPMPPEGDGCQSPPELMIRSTASLRATGAVNSELPVRYVCEELGYLAPVRVSEIQTCASPVGAAALMRTVAKAIESHAEALADGKVSPSEAQTLDVSLSEVQRVVVSLKAGLRPLILAGDEPHVPGPRKGPKAATPLIEVRRQTA